MESKQYVSALLVGAYESERLLIQEVFRKSGWRLYEAQDRRRAIHCLERYPVQVVIAETEMPNWTWKKLLTDLRGMAKAPSLVVTSRTADESLWAEVLNIGGFDVLAQPLEIDEVERVVASAYRHFEYAPERYGRPFTAAGAA